MAWWTEDKHEFVKQGLRDGLSTGQIARKLLMSRNAVIGRVHRCQDLQELLPPARRKKVAAEPSPRRPAAAVPDTPAPLFNSRHAAPALPPPLPLPPEPLMRFIPLNKVGSTACRFPVGEDRAAPGYFLFCGAKVAYAGATYCAHHHALCVTGRLGRAH